MVFGAELDSKTCWSIFHIKHLMYWFLRAYFDISVHTDGPNLFSILNCLFAMNWNPIIILFYYNFQIREHFGKLIDDKCYFLFLEIFWLILNSTGLSCIFGKGWQSNRILKVLASIRRHHKIISYISLVSLYTTHFLNTFLSFKTGFHSWQIINSEWKKILGTWVCADISQYVLKIQFVYEKITWHFF